MRLSIITPSLNRASMIERAINSVTSQGLSDFEHIIVDGGSTDGTLNVLSQYQHLRTVSERDRNLYDAINKGIRMASGEVIGILNTDDRLPLNALQTVVDMFQEEHVDVVAGAADIVRHDEIKGAIRYRYDHERVINLNERKVITGLTLTNACFFRRSVFERIGFFDTRFPVMSDREFLLRLVVSGAKVATTPRVLYEYTGHSGSLTFSSVGPSKSLAYAALELAEAGVAGTYAPALQAAFLRWHAWSTGYCALQAIKEGKLRDSCEFLRKGWGRDAFWPIKFAPYLLLHMLEARMRRGRRVEADA